MKYLLAKKGSKKEADQTVARLHKQFRDSKFEAVEDGQRAAINLIQEGPLSGPSLEEMQNAAGEAEPPVADKTTEFKQP